MFGVANSKECQIWHTKLLEKDWIILLKSVAVNPVNPVNPRGGRRRSGRRRTSFIAHEMSSCGGKETNWKRQKAKKGKARSLKKKNLTNLLPFCLEFDIDSL